VCLKKEKERWRINPLKEHLGGKGFHNNEEVIQDVQEWLHCKPKDFFLSDTRKLPDHWRKCIANQGDYVEKQQFQFQRIKSELFYLQIIIHICPTLVFMTFCDFNSFYSEMFFMVMLVKTSM
jgi:hypothetical protein